MVGDMAALYPARVTFTRTEPSPLIEYLPTVSGAPGTALDAALLDFEGRRMLGSAMTGLPLDPIRVYAGVRHGDAQERAGALAAELVRLGAGDRQWLVLGAPTGRGWVNHVLVRALECFAEGDIAFAAAQFGTERSASSSGMLDAAAGSLRAIVEAVRALPELRRLQLLVVGESFGGWTIGELLGELLEEPPAGIGLVATPGVARLDRRHGSHLTQLAAAGTRVVRLERANDPVVAIPGANLAWRPSRRWRAADERRWLPAVTLLRALRRIDEVTLLEEPSTLDLTIHDYRRDLPAVAADLLDVHDVARVARVAECVLTLEQERSTWYTAYGPEPLVSWPGLGI